MGVAVSRIGANIGPWDRLLVSSSFPGSAWGRIREGSAWERTWEGSAFRALPPIRMLFKDELVRLLSAPGSGTGRRGDQAALKSFDIPSFFIFFHRACLEIPSSRAASLFLPSACLRASRTRSDSP